MAVAIAAVSSVSRGANKVTKNVSFKLLLFKLLQRLRTDTVSAVVGVGVYLSHGGKQGSAQPGTKLRFWPYLTNWTFK